MEWDGLDLVARLLSTLGGSALPEGYTDLDKAKQIRHKLLSHGKEVFLGDRETIFINESSAEVSDHLALLEQLFNNNQVIALDTEYLPCEKNKPHLHDLFYIQVGGSYESPIFIIGKQYFSFFHKLFLSWLLKPNSLVLGFFLRTCLFYPLHSVFLRDVFTIKFLIFSCSLNFLILNFITTV